MKKPVSKYKDEKQAEMIREFAAEYFNLEASHESLITVTRAEMLDRGKRALVYFTALPQEKEASVLEFAERRKKDFRMFIMSKKSFGYAPRIDFCIDLGEHNRQRIDELSQQG